MDKLIQDLTAYVKEHRIFRREQRLLVAVSGGLDSVVLAHLCASAGFDFEIAHANFCLRGGESDRDEQFTRTYAASLNVPFHARRFDTSGYAAERKLSIQEAAREVRYAWFRELMKERELDVMLVAHHGDDNAETMLMNLFKGTGISGLRGMLPRVNDIGRPLLFLSRSEISAYAARNGLKYVDDSSNVTDKYTRNFVRLRVLPLLEQQFPGVGSNLRGNVERFRETEQIYREALDKRMKRLVVEKGEEWHIPVEKLRHMPQQRTVLFELFGPRGFSTGQLDEIVKLLDSSTGSMMFTSSHRLLKNRNWLILSPLSEDTQTVHVINEPNGEAVLQTGTVSLSMKPYSGEAIDPSHNIAILDAQQVQFPVLIRKWRTGDYFYPLGLKKKKKISRFLIDNKLNAVDKEKVLVAESAGRIIWVVGMRIDDRVRVKPSTRNVLVLRWS